jgi:hypothetical protein
MATAPESQDLTRTTINHLFARGATSTPQQRKQVHDMVKLMEAVAHAKETVKISPPTASDDTLPIKRLILDTDAACYRFQVLDAMSSAAVQQAKPFCIDLAVVLDKIRKEVREYAAELIALLCRTIHNQEVFSDLLLKAQRDVSIARQQASHHANQAQAADELIAEAHQQAASKISALEKTVEEQQEEATRVQLEATRPLWQWKEAAADPLSSVPSQEWYEAEMAYLQNKCSQLEVQNSMLSSNRQADIDRAIEAERRCRDLEIENESLRKRVDDMTSYKVFADSQMQTEPDLDVLVHNITPNLIARGGSAPSPPYTFQLLLRNSGKLDTYDLRLPENFKIVHEDYQENTQQKEAGKTKKIQKKKGRVRAFGASPFRKIVNNVSDHTSIVLTMRTTTRWVDELWAARIVTATKDGFEKLNMDPVLPCGDEFGDFIWNHFMKKYGSSHEASIHAGDMVTSLRVHRDTSPRIRIFSEFAGVDLRRPHKALSMYIIIVYHIMNVLRPDEDNGVVWCPLDAAERAAHILSKNKNLDPSSMATFYSNTLPELATVDPATAHKEKPLHVVDCDLFAEALAQLFMTEDHAEMEEWIDVVCENAERESMISLPRFLQLMGVLNAKLDVNTLTTEFERMTDNSDFPALTYDELLNFVRLHPLDGSPEETALLKEKNAPTFDQLQAAIDRFWYLQARRMRRTLEDLKVYSPILHNRPCHSSCCYLIISVNCSWTLPMFSGTCFDIRIPVSDCFS